MGIIVYNIPEVKVTNLDLFIAVNVYLKVL